MLASIIGLQNVRHVLRCTVGIVSFFRLAPFFGSRLLTLDRYIKQLLQSDSTLLLLHSRRIWSSSVLRKLIRLQFKYVGTQYSIAGEVTMVALIFGLVSRRTSSSVICFRSSLGMTPLSSLHPFDLLCTDSWTDTLVSHRRCSCWRTRS